MIYLLSSPEQIVIVCIYQNGQKLREKKWSKRFAQLSLFLIGLIPENQMVGKTDSISSISFKVTNNSGGKVIDCPNYILSSVHTYL